MQTFQLAAIQMNAPLGEVERNRAAVLSWSERAARAGAQFALFPELVISGHWCSGEVRGAAEPVPDGPTVQALIEAARDLDLVLSVGLAELAGGVVYNTQVLVGPRGYIGAQRKVHMSSDEYFYYRGGREMPVFDVGLCTVGTVICFDGLFPETARILAVQGAELLLMPHAARFGAWPEEEGGRQLAVRRQKDNWALWGRARAYDNGCYAAFVNQAGPAGPDTNHAGGTAIYGPRGELLAESQAEGIEDEMVLCTLTAEGLEQARSRRCFPLTVRRPELYGVLAQ
jgi:N-carbamoylputrescine amidase